MRILFVGMEHDYGVVERGLSYEEVNFARTFEALGHEVLRFDFLRKQADLGRREMNRALVLTAAEVQPDLAFFVLFRNEISPDTIRAVKRAGRTTTLNWFSDDHWRFDSFSRRFAPAFDWVVTTVREALTRYRDLGHRRVILSQWGCNHHLYRPTPNGIKHGITFVGQAYGDRPELIARIREAGFDVECFGRGWAAGFIDLTAMVHIFGSSEINLGFTKSWEPSRSLPVRIADAVRRSSPGVRPDQIKGRTFEVPGCMGFLLTEWADHLDEYFDIGREVAVFRSQEELVDQIRYWIDRPDEREAAAKAAYRRVIEEHTYERRFSEIFRTIGLA